MTRFSPTLARSSFSCRAASMIGESSSFESVRNGLIVLIGQWKELHLHSLQEKIQLGHNQCSAVSAV